jgi:hypothetical protein
MQANGFSTRYADGGGGAAGITSSPGLHERMPGDIGVTRANALYPSSKPFWKGVTHMQTTSMQTPVPRGGTLLRTARAVGRWFSRAVNAIGQPYAKPEANHWADWPHFPPF